MQFILLCVRSLTCFIKRDIKLFFWVLSGMMAASFMVLICSDYYFKRSSTAQFSEFVYNRCSFVFDNFSDIEQIQETLISDDSVNNVQILMRTNDDRIIASWHFPEKAHIKEKIISGNSQIDLYDDNWCICSYKYQQKQEILGDEKAIIGDLAGITDDISCTVAAIIRDYDYDMLVGSELMKDIIKNDGLISQVQVTYLFGNNISDTRLEELNSKIIDTFHPVNVIRPERHNTYSFMEFVQEMGSLILLMVLSVINYSLIYSYWIKKRLFTYQLFRMCGLSLSKMIGMIICEQLLFYISTHFLVSIVYSIFSQLTAANETPGVSDMVTQYLFTGVLLLIINAVVFSVIGFKTVRTSLAQA